MKKNAYLLLALFLGLIPASATAKKLQAVFTHRTFCSPENGPYVETYLSVNGKSVKYVAVPGGKFRGALEIGLKFTDSNGKISHNDHYNLLSPEVSDTNMIDFSFLDQQRISLPNGTYNLEMSVTDKNNSVGSSIIKETVRLDYQPGILSISDIELVDSFSVTKETSSITKSGFDIIPYADNFYPAGLNTLRFYAEIYNSNKVLSEGGYLLTFRLETAETKNSLDNLSGFTKQPAAPVNVLLREIPIKDLPSGNYNLILEIRNTKNELLATKQVFLQRSNKISVSGGNDFTSLDVSSTFVSFIKDKNILSDCILSMVPIASAIERTFIDNQLRLSDLRLMQQFFYDFWLRRSPVSPESAWINYHNEVLKVNKEFSTKILKGYQTERGRVYLQYGEPNTISRNYTEPSAYPYEIWHYYKLGNQSNRKFVFYNPDLVTNDFTLLHSDASGEPFNNQWELLLQKRNTQSRDYDVEYKGDYYGNKAKENFTNPK